MICVSTGQNITNLIPAVQYNITSALFLESETAKNKLWTEGIIKVLKKRGVKVLDVLPLSTEHNSDIFKIKEIIKSSLPNDPVIFNMGGGQKPHIIAMWELFLERRRDIACYADQDKRGILRFWKFENNKIISDVKNININLTAKEIFTTFGYEIQQDFKAIYGKNINYKTELLDFMNSKDFRNLLFEVPKFNEYTLNYNFTKKEFSDFINSKKELLSSKIEKQLITKLKDQEHKFVNFLKDENFRKLFYYTFINTALQKLLSFINAPKSEKSMQLDEINLINRAGSSTVIINYETFNKIIGTNKKPSFYFEDVCIQRMVDMLNNTNHNVVEAFANIKIKKENVIVAEYDILCVTNEGK